MTLQEAIETSRGRAYALAGTEFGQEQAQLAAWLEELLKAKQKLAESDRTIEGLKEAVRHMTAAANTAEARVHELLTRAS